MRYCILVCLAVAFVTGPGIGQQGSSQEELQSRYEVKLTADFIAHGGWTLDYDEAKARAKAEGKLIFVYFGRSYAP